MNSILNIIHKTKLTFNNLDDQFEDDLEVKTTAIFMVYGLVMAIESIFKDNIFGYGIKMIIISLGVGAASGFIGKYIFSYIIFWIGKLLKGNSEIMDIKAVAAYSLIPKIIGLPITLYLGLSGKFGHLKGIELYIINGLNILLTLLSFKILIQGLIRFNGYGFFKAVLNISPFILLGISLIFIALFR